MLSALLALGLSIPAADPMPASRTFLFTNDVKLMGLEPGKTARVWLPVPVSTADQDVKSVVDKLPAKGSISREPIYGNSILYVEGAADQEGMISLSLTYRVTRRERLAGPDKELDAIKTARLLQADTMVPVGGKSVMLLKGKEVPPEPEKAARLFYDTVFGHMRYSKEGEGWGRGDADWACDSGRGNCSDFHSLFIALTRWQKIPAVFEIGFPLPEKRGEGEIPGYHCWAQVQLKDKEWFPVDISEASKAPARREYYFGHLNADRVLLSRGRDIDLVPKQAGGPLNYFVHAYAEVDGKPWLRVEKRYSYRDVGENDQ